MRNTSLILIANLLISLGHEEGMRMRKAALMMRKSVMDLLRIDPDGRVLGLTRAAGMGAFVVGRQHRDALGKDLSGVRVDHGIAAKRMSLITRYPKCDCVPAYPCSVKLRRNLIRPLVASTDSRSRML